MRRIALISFALALVAAPAALAGGWATAGLSSTPAGTGPGAPWNVDITLMQHGRTPLEGMQPAIVVTDSAGKETRFAGKEVGNGVYRTSVVFPERGRYTYTVDDGFGNAFPHEFPPVQIGAAGTAPATPAPDSGGTPWWPFAVVAAGLAAGGGLVLMRRRRSGAPLPA
jgi:LPXTG-motif cell wall-anchored protein